MGEEKRFWSMARIFLVSYAPLLGDDTRIVPFTGTNSIDIACCIVTRHKSDQQVKFESSTVYPSAFVRVAKQCEDRCGVDGAHLVPIQAARVYHIRVKKAKATAKAHDIKDYESLDAACSRVKDWVHKDCKVEVKVVTGSTGKNLVWTSDPKGMYKELQEKHEKEPKKDQKKQTARQEGNGSGESDGPSDQPPHKKRKADK